MHLLLHPKHSYVILSEWDRDRRSADLSNAAGVTRVGEVLSGSRRTQDDNALVLTALGAESNLRTRRYTMPFCRC